MPAPSNKKYFPVSGLKIHKWTFLRPSDSSEHWVCICQCGNEREVRTAKAFSGKTKQCRDCRAREMEVPPLSKYLVCVRGGAKTRNLEFTVTEKEVQAIFDAQGGRCRLSGVPLEIGRKKTASLDRIDSKRGYVIDNIQWVHKYVNAMKSDFIQQEYIDFCILVANWNSRC